MYNEWGTLRGHLITSAGMHLIGNANRNYNHVNLHKKTHQCWIIEKKYFHTFNFETSYSLSPHEYDSTLNAIPSQSTPAFIALRYLLGAPKHILFNVCWVMHGWVVFYYINEVLLILTLTPLQSCSLQKEKTLNCI